MLRNISSRIVPVIGILCVLLALRPAIAQTEDEFEDFDPSMFEEAGTTLKAFCTNKVNGQSPTQLVSVAYDFQGPATLTSPAKGSFAEEEIQFDYAHGFRIVSNIPVLSKNNILINWGLNVSNINYVSSESSYNHPLNNNLASRPLNWINTSVSVFKPLNEKRFLLIRGGIWINGDYNFTNLPDLSKTRFGAAFIYGFKPNDRFIWGPGVVRTYLGGALNYLPVVYFYKTFKNEKWGVEAIAPAFAYLRYRFNSRNLMLLGYTVEGATFHMSNFNSTPNAIQINPNDNIELRRSELRAGLTYSRGLNDFIWVSVQGGYRINWSYNLDEGDFFRGFDDSDYFMENELSNTPFFQVSLSLVSP